MTREEAVEKVAFACSVPETPTAIDDFLKTAALDPPPSIVDLSRMNPTQITLPDEIPPEVAEITPDESWPSLGPFVPPILGGAPTGGLVLPIVPPETPPLVGEIPEPSSLVLSGSGLVCMLLLGLKLRRAESKRA
jgi:hypothetical protein